MKTTTIEQDVNKAIAEGHTYKSIMVGAIMNYDGLWDFSYADEIAQANKKNDDSLNEAIAVMVSDLLSEVMDDKNEWVEYPEDVASSWADGMVDIMYYNQYTNLVYFTEATSEALSQFDKPESIERLLMMGQYLAYERFAHDVLEYAKSLDNLIK